MLLLRPSAAKFKKKKKSWAYSPNTFLSYFFFKLFTTVLPRIQSVFLLCFFTVFSLQKNWSNKMTVWWRIKHHNGSTKELLLESRPWGHVTVSATFSPHDSWSNYCICLTLQSGHASVTCNGRNTDSGMWRARVLWWCSGLSSLL